MALVAFAPTLLRLNLDGMLVYLMRGEGFVVWGRGGGGVLSCFSARPVLLFEEVFAVVWFASVDGSVTWNLTY